MLDRPMRGPKAPGTCRILFVGDSFVEAAQVPIEAKLQSVIEKLARSRADLPPIEAAAVGYSGTGQSAQLPLYERIGRRFEADLIVLVFVSNDFADNSAAFAAMTHGWHPRHPPRVFFVPDGETGGFARVPIDPQWRAHAFAETAPAVAGAGARARAAIDARLAATSRLYAFVRSHMTVLFPARAPDARREARVEWLAGLDGYAGALDGWDRARFPDPSGAFFEAQ